MLNTSSRSLTERLFPYLPMTVATIIWGVMVLPTSWILEEMAPLTVLMIRSIVAVALSAAFALWKWKSLRPAPGELRWLIFMGLTGVTVNNLCYFLAMERTSMVNVVVIYSASPVVTILLAHLFLNERLGWRRLLGAILAVGGVVVLFTGGRLNQLSGVGLAGDLWELVAVLGGATMAVAAVKIQGTPASIALFYTMLAGLAGTMSIGFFWGMSLPATLGVRSLFALVYLGVLGSCVAYGCQQMSAVAIGASASMAFTSATPVLGILAAWAGGGEAVTGLQMGCAAVILFGLWLNAAEGR